MANYTTLKASVNAYIKANGVRAITGPVLNGILTQMINTLGDGARYGGIATPSGNPGTHDNVVFFLATTAGTYTNYGGAVLDGSTLHILYYDSTWHDLDTGVPTSTAFATKADKDEDAVEGNIAMFDSNGNPVDGGVSVDALNQLGQELGGDEATKTMTSADFSGIIYDGSGFIAATGTYNAFIIYCPAGMHVRITAETGTGIKRVFRVKPEIGVTAAAESFSQDCWYDAENDAYLHITCYVSDSPSITAVCSAFGIKKELQGVGTITEENNETIGVSKSTQVYDSDAFAGVFWAGTYVAKATSRFNGVIIPIKAGCAYDVQNAYSLVTFSDIPLLGYGAGMLRSVSQSFTANEGEKYLLATIDLSSYTTIELSTDGVGILPKIAEIQEIKNELGQTEKNTILTSADFCGYFWGGDKVYAASARFNGFLIPLISGVKYIVSDMQNLALFSSTPVVGSNAGFIEMLTSNNTFIATEQTKFCLISVSPDSVPITLFSSGYGIGGKVSFLEKQTQGGKTICFGDSNTEFGDTDGLRYTDHLELITGRVFINAGIGGTRYAGRAAVVTNPTSVNEAYAALDLVNLIHAWVENDWTAVDNANQYLITEVGDDNTQAINNLKNNPISGIDNVIIMAGTNDYGGNTPLGTPGDVDTTTLCGSMGHIFGELLGAKRGLKIYICGTIIRWFVTNGDISTYIPENFSDFKIDSTGKSVIDYNDAIQETSKYYHTPFCDMYYSLGWNMLNFFEYFGEPGVDSWANGTHPFRGYSTIAKRISGFINSHRQ